MWGAYIPTATIGAENEQPLPYCHHFAALALVVVRIVPKHPALLQRQAWITDMLWHIGIGQRPFQVTSALGYDNVDERFIQLAGESRSLLPDLRQAFQAYNLWTEGEGQFWVLRKPALPLFIGFFTVGFCLVRTHDRGVLLVALLPLLSVLLLLISFPFPAYRYAYPSVVMVTQLERWDSPARLHAGIRSQ
jgi:hypothetical protein